MEDQTLSPGSYIPEQPDWLELMKFAMVIAPPIDQPVEWAQRLITVKNMWCVPVQGKNPATAGGLKNAVNDPEEFVRNYATCRGATGYGIHLGRSHLAVFDLDVTAEHPLEELEEALDAWFNANTQDGLPKTLVVRTGRETGTGRHYYFRLPVGVELRSTRSFLGLPIEVRTGEQIVVGPGSLHP